MVQKQLRILRSIHPQPGPTGVESRRRHNVSDDFLNLNLTRNLNLPKDFGGKSKIKIKNFAKCLNSMAVLPDPPPLVSRGERETIVDWTQHMPGGTPGPF